MPESLYSPNQKVLSKQGKENWDKIDWNVYTLDQTGDLVYIGKDNKLHKYPKVIYEIHHTP